MTYQLRNVVIAVVLGLLAAVLTTVYVTNYRKNVQHGQQDVGVLVAATNIPAGTSGAAIVSGHMLVRKTIPRTALVPGAISSPDQISRLVSTQEVMVGEQVTKSRFGGANELGVRAQLKGTMRAFQVSANPNQVLAGTLRTGDHVDIVANLKVDTAGNSGQSKHYDRVVLRDLLVLRAPTAPDTKSGNLTSTQNYNVMLAVTDAQASKLLFIVDNSDANASQSGGGWTLQLRPVTNAADSPENIESIETILLDGLSPAERARVIGGK
jgi:Flp pilus assembly protein CpaB